MDTLVGGRGNCCFLFHNDAAIMDLGRLGLGAFFPAFKLNSLLYLHSNIYGRSAVLNFFQF